MSATHRPILYWPAEVVLGGTAALGIKRTPQSISRGFRAVQKPTGIFRKIILDLKPCQAALPIDMKAGLKIIGVGKGRGIKMHAPGIMIRLKPDWRSTAFTKMPVNARRTFIGFRLGPCPFKILKRDTQPGSDRGGTIASAIITMAITGPAYVARKFKTCCLAQTVPESCHA